MLRSIRFVSTAIAIAWSTSAIAAEPASTTPQRRTILRYAVIVGSNSGRDPDAGEMPKLVHAESEASRLRDKLVHIANFDPSEERTKVLLGAKKDGVARAIAEIAAQVEADRKTFPETRTLFGFFFTGHGLSERLLLSDGPIYAKELSEMLQTIHADFTVGFFDACFSGSLTQLSGKGGVRPTPGFNVFRELPEDMLGAEGAMWFVSSAPNELSYEDSELGGVFTYFFIEALDHADMSGPGITLDRIWTYAQTKTVQYTMARQREQTPQQIVSHLKMSSPLYFSFPRKREARLVLSSAMSGRFLLAYEGSELSEVVRKDLGAPLELDVFSGRAHLIMIGAPERWEESIELAPGALTLVEREGERERPEKPGEVRQTLLGKGVVISRITTGSILSFGLGYQLSLVREGVLASERNVRVGARWDAELFAAAFELALGVGGEQIGSWAYDLRAYSAEARAGISLRAGEVRIGLMFGLEASRLEQEFHDGAVRPAMFSIAPLGSIEALIPLNDRWTIALTAEGGVLVSPGAGASVDNVVSPIARFGLMPMIAF